MAKSNAFKMKLPSVDDLFSTEESRQEVKLKKLYDIPLSEIDDFPDHPYRVIDDSDSCVTNLSGDSLGKKQNGSFTLAWSVIGIAFYNKLTTVCRRVCVRIIDN